MAAATLRLPVSVVSILIWCWAWMEIPTPIEGAPIKITFDGCVPGFANNKTLYCCPPKYSGPIVDFCPKRDITKPLRQRKALQCLSGKELKVYKKKLDKAYTILRNLPDDDPRSLYQHHTLHCAYGTGAFVQQGTGNITIDIHFSWLFYPFHRYFIYFHERILQHLLDDPDFTIHFWNWDNADTLPKSDRPKSGCFKAGNILPKVYNDSRTGQYEPRSNRTHIKGLPVDQSIIPEERANPPTRLADVVLPRNLASLYASMMVTGNNTRGFMGRTYRYGDSQVLDPLTGGGSLEIMSHASIHWWVGSTMGVVETSAGDPLFYAHHCNIDRMWERWHSIPGGERKDPDDPDFLDAEFLFWDETATLRRVKVKDALDREAFGYEYEKTYDAPWVNYVPPPVNATTNSTGNVTGMSSLPDAVHFPTRWNRV